jgi:hypothetical protein
MTPGLKTRGLTTNPKQAVLITKKNFHAILRIYEQSGKVDGGPTVINAI